MKFRKTSLQTVFSLAAFGVIACGADQQSSETQSEPMLGKQSSALTPVARGVRRTVHELSQSERQALANAILDFINQPILDEHARAHDWHHPAVGELFFLRHHDYLHKLERHLVDNGFARFVPLPVWDPATSIPAEFLVTDPLVAHRPMNASPNSPLPASSSNPCTFSSMDDYARAIENWHDGVHMRVGGAMGGITTSPATPVFWIWHGFVDELYHRRDLCGSDATRQSFPQYSLWGADYRNAAGWHTAPWYWQSLQYADVNGDHRMDACARGEGGVYCALSNGSIFASYALWNSEFRNSAGWTTQPSYFQTLQFPDVNGDGQADVCARGAGGVHCAVSNGSSFGSYSLWTPEFRDGIGWDTDETNWQTLRFPDVNGDGRADVCARGDAGVYCALSNGTGFQGYTLWTTEFSDAGAWETAPSYWKTLQFPDVNGDGRADVCARGELGIRCAVSNGSSFFFTGGTSLWIAAFGDAHGFATRDNYWETLRFPDVNGDARADVCARGANGIYCAISQGVSFDSYGLWTLAFGDTAGWDSSETFWKTLQFPDVNGDRRADVCARGEAGVHCAVSTGSAFANYSLWTSEYRNGIGWESEPYYWQTLEFADVNGDRQADVCARGEAGIFCAR